MQSLHLGSNITAAAEDIIGIFDMDNATTARATREFLRSAEEEGMVITVGSELPKSFVVCCPKGSWQRVYLSPLAASSLAGRLAGALPRRPYGRRDRSFRRGAAK